MQPGERVGERYEVDHQAGMGAMGVVYRGHDIGTREPVAIKVLRAAAFDGVSRFAREAQVLSQLQLPEVGRYLTHGLTSLGEAFIVMEWLDGETLKDRMDRGRMSLGEVVYVATAIATALDAAHTRGIVHRDIKPANVMIVGELDAHGTTPPGAVKVVDFGVARFRDGGETLTDTGALIGTPAFMSPEQARGTKDIDGKSDLFSLGSVIFRCLTGRTPFEAEDSGAVVMLLRLSTGRAPAIGQIVPGLPARLARLVDSLLAPHPGDRPASGAVVARELVDIQRALGPLALTVPSVLETDPTVRDTTVRRPRFRPPALILIGLGGVLATVATAYWITSHRAPGSGENGATVVSSDDESDSGRPIESASSAPAVLLPLSRYEDENRTYDVMLECPTPHHQRWPSVLESGMMVERDLVECDTPNGFVSISHTETTSGNAMGCELTNQMGDQYILNLLHCDSLHVDPIDAKPFLALSDTVSCPKTQMNGELRFYCDPRLAEVGKGRVFVVSYQRFRKVWSTAGAAKFFASFHPH